MGLPAGGGRHELHCGLRDGAPAGGVRSGLCFLFLAVFCWLIEMKGYRKWAFPLVVVGMNSIAAYVMAHLWERFFMDSLRIHLGPRAFQFLGLPYEPLLRGAAVLLLYWVVLLWMYRRKLLLRI